MKRNKSIQIKAAFLIIVFSMNMVIGLACAMGLDMGFNHKHHDDDKTIIRETSHHRDKSCHHNEVNNDHDKSKEPKDNCCDEGVVKFAQVDKLLIHSSNFTVNPVCFNSFVSLYYNNDILPSCTVTKSIKYFVRGHHPPISDIRIKIRSFQI